MAVATATFNDSGFELFSAKEGIKSLSEINGSISEEIPFPSFPMTSIPVGESCCQ